MLKTELGFVFQAVSYKNTNSIVPTNPPITDSCCTVSFMCITVVMDMTFYCGDMLVAKLNLLSNTNQIKLAHFLAKEKDT